MKLKLYSWNVNGIRASYKKGLLDWVRQSDGDIICFQETKANPIQLEDELRQPDGYHTYWASATRGGYSGVALYSKLEPKWVQIGLGIADYDDEGRTVVAEFENFVLIGAYFPNGGQENQRVPFKMAYKAAFLEFCNQLRAQGKSVIFCGDVNTAHQEIDLARPKENVNTTGFMPIERAWIDEIIRQGYVDIYRALHPDQAEAYTWWPYWSKGARERNRGWRIDYFFITPELQPRVVSAEIHPEVIGSDHCPVSLTLEVGE
jgi:exodeoxyribonuclease-3